MLRRKALREKNDLAYKEIVFEGVGEEEQLYKEIAEEALTYLKVSEEEYRHSQSVHM